jgi:hypothetical protein
MTSGVQIINKLKPSNAIVPSENNEDDIIKPIFLSKEEREKIKKEKEKMKVEFKKIKEIENKNNKKEFVKTILSNEEKKNKKKRSRSRSRSRNRSVEKKDTSKGLISEEINAIKVGKLFFINEHFLKKF